MACLISSSVGTTSLRFEFDESFKRRWCVMDEVVVKMLLYISCLVAFSSVAVILISEAILVGFSVSCNAKKGDPLNHSDMLLIS